MLLKFDQLEKKVVNALISFKQKKVEQMINRLQERLKTVHEEEASNNILMEIKDLIEMKVVFAGRLGRVIVK